MIDLLTAERWKSLALLTDEFVLDFLDVPPVPDAGRPIPPEDVELNDVVRMVGNGNLVKIVDPVFGAKPLILFIEPVPRFGFGEVPQLRRRDQFRRIHC